VSSNTVNLSPVQGHCHGLHWSGHIHPTFSRVHTWEWGTSSEFTALMGSVRVKACRFPILILKWSSVVLLKFVYNLRWMLTVWKIYAPPCEWQWIIYKWCTVASGTFKYVVPRLTCHHEGTARVMTFQPWPLLGWPAWVLPRFSASENRLPGLSCGIVCMILRLAVSVKHRLVTDRHTTTLIPVLASVTWVKHDVIHKKTEVD